MFCARNAIRNATVRLFNNGITRTQNKRCSFFDANNKTTSFLIQQQQQQQQQHFTTTTTTAQEQVQKFRRNTTPNKQQQQHHYEAKKDASSSKLDEHHYISPSAPLEQVIEAIKSLMTEALSEAKAHEDNAKRVNGPFKTIISLMVNQLKQDPYSSVLLKQLFEKDLNRVMSILFDHFKHAKDCGAARNLVMFVSQRLRDSNNLVPLDVIVAKNHYMRILSVTNESYKRALSYFENAMKANDHFNEATFQALFEILAERRSWLEMDAVRFCDDDYMQQIYSLQPFQMKSITHRESLTELYQSYMEHYLNEYGSIYAESGSIGIKKYLIIEIAKSFVNIELKKMESLNLSVDAKRSLVSDIHNKLLAYCQQINIDPFEVLDRAILKLYLYPRLGLAADGLQYFDSLLKRKDNKLQVETYNIVLEHLARQGRIDEVKRLLTDMQSNGTKPNDITFQLILSSLSNPSQASAALKLLPELVNLMNDLNIPANAEFNNSVINCYTWKKDVEKIKQFFESLGSDYKRIDQTTNWTTLSAYIKLGKIKYAEELANRLRRAHVRIPGHIRKEFTNFYQKSGDLEGSCKWGGANRNNKAPARAAAASVATADEQDQNQDPEAMELHKKRLEEAVNKKYQNHTARMNRTFHY